MADNVWRGTAVDLYDIHTITVGGTWAATDSQTITVNGNDLVITTVSSTTTANIAVAISNAINASDRTTNLQNDETRNVGGQEIPEFTEFSATAASSVVTITANNAGIPFTLSSSPSSASGTLTDATSSAATGRNFFNNADNWSQGSAPVVGDNIIFENSDIDCLYGLSQSAVTNVTMQILATYTGKIGLPKRNSNGYDEYRQRHLQIKFSSSERGLVIGEGTGNASQRINIDASTSDPKVVIAASANPETGAKAAIDLIDTADNGLTVTVLRGSVSLAGDTSNAAKVTTLEMSSINQVATDAQVVAGENATLTTITKQGGNLTLLNTPSGGTITTLTQYAGDTELNGQSAVTTMNLYGGTVWYNSTGTLSTVNLGGTGVLDFGRDTRSKTVTIIERYSDDSAVLDPGKVVSSLIIDNNQTSNVSNLDIGTNFKLTRGAVT